MEQTDKINFVKTVLYAFPHLKSLQEALCDSISNKAALSYKHYDTLTAMEEIAREIFLKDAIARLLSDVTEILGELSEEERYMLGYKYFHERGDACRLDFSERSYFRKQRALVDKMSCLLRKKGWTQPVFMREFKESAFFMRMYRAVCERGDQAIVCKRRKKTLRVS